MNAVHADASPFELGPAHARRGVLLVHGFTGTPFEMRLLGESLAQRGFAVSGVALAGHCGTTADLAATRWPDWLHSVERGFDKLKGRCERAGVCGLSLGGLLTLELARRRPVEVEAIAMLAPALWLTPAAMRFDRAMQRLPFARGFALPKLAGSDIRDPELRRRNGVAQGKAGMPLPALHSLVELGHYLKTRLGEVRQPTLLMHGRRDHTIPFACMEHIARSLGTPRAWIRELPLEQSFHVLTLDVEREEVFRAVAEHLQAHLRIGESSGAR